MQQESTFELWKRLREQEALDIARKQLAAEQERVSIERWRADKEASDRRKQRKAMKASQNYVCNKPQDSKPLGFWGFCWKVFKAIMLFSFVIAVMIKYGLI